MKIPRVKKRRQFERGKQGSYLESDKDFLDNNLRAALWFLEHRDEIALLVTETRFKRFLADQAMYETNGQDG